MTAAVPARDAQFALDVFQVFGDDDQAKATVTAFLDSIGYDAVDVGPLAESWRQEPDTPVYRRPYGPDSDESGTPAGAGTIRAALAAARR